MAAIIALPEFDPGIILRVMCDGHPFSFKPLIKLVNDLYDAYGGVTFLFASAMSNTREIGCRWRAL